MVRAIHRLHGEFVPFSSGDSEEVVFELIPMTTCFVKVLFGDVGDFYLLIPVLLAELPDEVVEFVSQDSALRCPEGKPTPYKVREYE
jgi:hypothetical protein